MIRLTRRVKDKELEKVEKYQLLKDEIAKVWRMLKVHLINLEINTYHEVTNK